MWSSYLFTLAQLLPLTVLEKCQEKLGSNLLSLTSSPAAQVAAHLPLPSDPHTSGGDAKLFLFVLHPTFSHQFSLLVEVAFIKSKCDLADSRRIQLTSLSSCKHYPNLMNPSPGSPVGERDVRRSGEGGRRERN